MSGDWTAVLGGVTVIAMAIAAVAAWSTRIGIVRRRSGDGPHPLSSLPPIDVAVGSEFS